MTSISPPSHLLKMKLITVWNGRMPDGGKSSNTPSPLHLSVVLVLCLLAVDKFVVGSNRVIFMLRDGSYAWEIKDFLVAQDRCEDVTVEGQVYPGKAAKKDAKGNKQNETKKKGDKKAANRANKSKQEL